LVGNFGTMGRCEPTWRSDIEDQDEDANETWKPGYENFEIMTISHLVRVGWRSSAAMATIFLLIYLCVNIFVADHLN
jgi:hypothetical protein